MITTVAVRGVTLSLIATSALSLGWGHSAAAAGTATTPRTAAVASELAEKRQTSKPVRTKATKVAELRTKKLKAKKKLAKLKAKKLRAKNLRAKKLNAKKVRAKKAAAKRAAAKRAAARKAAARKVGTPRTGTQLAPAWRGTGTYFGTALSGGDGSIPQALAKNDALFGRLPAVRQFDPTVPPEGAWSRRAVLNDRVVVTSFREPPADILTGKHDARLLRYFKEAPTQRPVFWSYFHEPEPHIDAGTFTHAQYRSAWRHLVRLASKAGKSNLYPTLILTGWTTEAASRRNWRSYYPGDEYISVVAWDPYNSATGKPTSYPDPAKLYASVVKASKESGKPWGIAETGSAFVPGDRGAGRAAWLTKVGNYFAAQGAVFVTYFQSNRDGNFKLTDPASVSAWSAFVRRPGQW